MKVFLDANILYSASRPGSLMQRFIAVLMHSAECCTNHYALEEARRNLTLREDTQCLSLLTQLEKRLTVIAELVPVDVALREKDKPILYGAIAASCTHLLTSDKRDFGSFFGKTIGGVKIISPERMAVELGLKKEST